MLKEIKCELNLKKMTKSNQRQKEVQAKSDTHLPVCRPPSAISVQNVLRTQHGLQPKITIVFSITFRM